MKEPKKSNRKRLYYAILSVLLALLFLLVSINEFLNNDYENSKTITFLGNESIAPIIYNKNGTAKGIAVDIAEELGKKIGYKIKVKAMNWETAQNAVLLGDAEALIHINSNTEREELYDFSDEFLKSEFSIFIKSGNINIKNVNDLNNKTVGVEKSGYPLTLLQKYGVMNIEIISDWETGFSKVVSGELDAIVVDRWIGEYELAQNGVKDIQIVDEPIETQYSRIAVKKGNWELLNLINTGLKDINNDGTMDNILKNWRGKKVIYLTQESFRNILLHIVIVFLGIILLIALYSVNKYRKLSRKLEIDVKERTKELYETNKLLLKANAELEKISILDELTAISNRRGFDIAFEKSWKVSRNSGQPLAVIMIDIDHFKFFNDTYGHLVGDQCLIRVAKELKAVAKKTGNFLARFGGEEFVVMLLDTTEEGAAFVAENMRKKIENLEIENSNLNSIVTISLGVASVIPNDNMSPEDLINAADRALYQAKKDGRNKVVKSEEMFF